MLFNVFRSIQSLCVAAFVAAWIVACDPASTSPKSPDAATDATKSATGGLVSTGGTAREGGAVATGGVPSTGGVFVTGGIAATTGGTTSGGTTGTGGVSSTGGATPKLDAQSADSIGVDAGRSDVAIPDATASTPRDSGADLARDSAAQIPRDGASSDALINPSTGFANCPVSSGTTPLPPPGGISWSLSMSASPTAAEQDAYNRIIPAMNTAVCMYSAYTTLTKRLTVQYNAGVATADGTTDGASATGNIRFGSTASMNYITAMHEMSHTFGIGGTKFNSMCVNGVFSGTNATAEIRAITGVSTETVKCGGSHFWPYGLNYTTEWKDNSEGKNHCRMVLAIRKDLGL